jgi:hypothetical protein
MIKTSVPRIHRTGKRLTAMVRCAAGRSTGLGGTLPTFPFLIPNLGHAFAPPRRSAFNPKKPTFIAAIFPPKMQLGRAPTK